MSSQEGRDAFGPAAEHPAAQRLVCCRRYKNTAPDEIVKPQKDPLKRKGYRQLEMIKIMPAEKGNPALALPGGRIDRLSGNRQAGLFFHNSQRGPNDELSVNLSPAP